MRSDVLKEKTEMEKIWDYWDYNLKGKGIPPASPYIMDWERISFTRDLNESQHKLNVITFIFIYILLFSFVGIILLKYFNLF